MVDDKLRIIKGTPCSGFMLFLNESIFLPVDFSEITFGFRYIIKQKNGELPTN